MSSQVEFFIKILRLEVFRKINPFWSFQINGAYMIEETSPEIERERFSIELLINRAF